MVRALLVRGLVAGAVAGLFAALFAWAVAEPAVDAAIGYEAAKEAAAGSAGAPEVVPRALQKTLGLATATTVYGAAIGGLFALAFALSWRRLLGGGPGRAALSLAAIAFVVVFLVPFLKYPAHPPAVGDPASIDRRTALFVTMIWISIAASVAAVRAAQAVRRRWQHALSPAGGRLLAALGYAAIVAAAALALPAIRELPRDFPATTLWSFRIGSVGTQAVLWAVLGAAFAEAAERLLAGRSLWFGSVAARTGRAGVAADTSRRGGGP